MQAGHHAYDELKAVIAEHGGLYLTTMEELREAQGVGRLGTHVRTGILSELRRRGIGTLPEVLPPSQHDEVRLYRTDTALGMIIAAVRHPNPAGDVVLRRSMNCVGLAEVLGLEPKTD